MERAPILLDKHSTYVKRTEGKFKRQLRKQGMQLISSQGIEQLGAHCLLTAEAWALYSV